MAFLENPVLQRELLVNLRMNRAFLLMLLYVGLLGLVVYLAWPRPALGEESVRIDFSKPEAAQRLINTFFLGQFILASMMTPSFAAGTITGEKEAKTYEMLLASPLSPRSIVFGKLLAALCHLVLLIFSSLPIVVLCLPLGGVSIYEVLAAYFALILSVITFGMISMAASSYFQKTAASLVVSYLIILPPALIGVWFWITFANAGAWRLGLMLTVLPVLCGGAWIALYMIIYMRLVQPPDFGSEGKEVVDVDAEQSQAVGLVIRRDQFPDRLFAPAKRVDLLADGANPILDKEMRSELFSQGTLMLRVVIQVSMVLAIPLMAACLFFTPWLSFWYVDYVLLFNLLVGPVFSAGTVTSERERKTLELLLTTTISPWAILTGKLISGLRVSMVLTSFLLWPMLLACALVSDYWSKTMLLAVGTFLLIVVVTCVTTATVALVCSVLFRKSSVAILVSYLVLAIIFMAPLAVEEFGYAFFQDQPWTQQMDRITFLSPYAAVYNVPLDLANVPNVPIRQVNPIVCVRFLGFYLCLNVALISVMAWLFRRRYRVVF